MPVAVPSDLAAHAADLLKRHGHAVTTVHDVDTEGPGTTIAFTALGKAKTACVRRIDGKERVEVADGWDVL